MPRLKDNMAVDLDARAAVLEEDLRATGAPVDHITIIDHATMPPGTLTTYTRELSALERRLIQDVFATFEWMPE